MEKYYRHVAVHANVALVGCFAGVPMSLLLIWDPSSLASSLGYGLSGVLLLTAMMLLLARAVESLTRKYGAAEEAAELDWRLDAAVCVLVFPFCLAYFSAAAAIQYALGFGAFIYLPLVLMAILTIVAFRPRWIICQLYRYLLWARFGAKRAAAISLSRGSVFPLPNPFLLAGSRQTNIPEFMPCVGICLGGMVAAYFAFAVTLELEFGIRYIDGFDMQGYLMSELLYGTLLLLGGYWLIYLYAIANNAWRARREAAKLRVSWTQACAAFMFALILLPAQVVLMSAISFLFSLKLGIFLMFAYFVLLILLFDKKWLRAQLVGYVSLLDFGKKGAA